VNEKLNSLIESFFIGLKWLIKNSRKPDSKEVKSPQKTHPWRLCEVGEHWVLSHPLWIPPTEKREGYYTTRDAHCAVNPTRAKRVVKDYLTVDEMKLIAEKYFKDLAGLPAADNLDFKNGNDYDHIIRGWTKYWNDIFKPNPPLDPDLVKALISTESGFRLSPEPQKAGKAGLARGFIQLTDEAIKALGDTNGELREHYIKITEEDTSDPNISVGAGIRWLHRKRELASRKLKREATWDEAIAEYKGYLPDLIKGKPAAGMKNLKRDYKRLKNEK
jgi:hypothetical protein